MGFWTRVLGIDGITANANLVETPPSVGEPDWEPGDPEGLEVQGFDETFTRSLPFVQQSPWSGWPADWSTPAFSQMGINRLVDVAWACLDKNSNVLSSMPVYQMRNGQIIAPETWMSNPDPDIYNSWQEFAKQLFWDYQMGEAFVLCMARGSDGFPMRFRVIPPWLINVEMARGRRHYTFGGQNVTGDILHIRYSSNTIDPHGHGPLEVAGARMTAIGLLQRYANNLAETGGVPLYWIGVERRLTQSEGTDLMDQWIESRTKYAGYPAILGSKATLNQAKAMSAHDMSLLELQQFNESRISVLLGVPPFLVGLAGASGSLTYSNVADLNDYHDRGSLRPMASACMAALGQWALPSTRSVELNRDDYTRPPLKERAPAYKILIEAGVLTAEEVRAMERFRGEPSAATILTGGID